MKNRYEIIYADPPWKYNARSNRNTRFGGGAQAHYPLMAMNDIEALPVPSLAAKNCVLLMWCTFPYLDQQLRLFSHWGFAYKTLGFSWIKTNKVNQQPFFGVGYYAKSNAEICLLGMRGSLKPVSNRVSSCIVAPRRAHSCKPDEVRDRIVELFGDRPRVELFARTKKAGWDVWGNEVKSDLAWTY